MVITNTHRTARGAGHARLYHYETFCRHWLSTTLRDQAIHCSSPAGLNDPWDCRPWFNERSIQTPEQIEQFLTWYHNWNAAPLTPDQRAQFDAKAYNVPLFRKELLDGLAASFCAEICKRRIYCLTPDPLSTLMWSHYADNHRGICLEFHIGNELFLDSCWEVTYHSEYPNWTPQTMDAYIADMLLTKSDDWRYESEFRLVGSPFFPEGHPLKLHGDGLRLPRRALISVIVGGEGTREYDEVVKIVNTDAPGLPVRRVVRVPNRYRLTIEG